MYSQFQTLHIDFMIKQLKLTNYDEVMVTNVYNRNLITFEA